MVEFRITWQTFGPPSQSYKKIFAPSHVQHENFWYPAFNIKSLTYKVMRIFFNPPQKKCKGFSNPLKLVSKYLPHLSTTLHWWIKNDRPLNGIFWELGPLFDKRGLTIFQNMLLSVILLRSIFIIFLSFFLVYLLQKFFCFLKAVLFSSVGRVFR